MADYDGMQAHYSFRPDSIPVHLRSPANQDEAQCPISHMLFEGRTMLNIDPESLNNYPSWVGIESPSRTPQGGNSFTNDHEGFDQPPRVSSAVPSSPLLLGLSGWSDEHLTAHDPPLSSGRVDQYSSRDQATTTNCGNIGYASPPSHVYQSPADVNPVQGISNNSDRTSRGRIPVQPHTSYFSAYPREHGPLSQYGMQVLMSHDRPWSPHDKRVDHQQTDLRPNTSPNLGRLDDSDENLSDTVLNHELFSVSSGSEQVTEESSIDLSASTVTVIPRVSSRGRVLVDANDTISLNSFRPSPPLFDAPNHYNESQKLSSQNHHFTTRTRSESRPSFASNDAQLLDIPQQQAWSDPSSPSSSPASAVSPSTLDTLVCTICRAEFTGDYRKGNYSRHDKLKHGGVEKRFPCEGRGCKKGFKRQDARLKHYRKHHVELTSGPAASRRSHP